MAMPSAVTVEIEFTAGVWTDVTTYFDSGAGGSTRFGRTSPFGATSPGTLTVTLSNQDGRFTPGRQVLADGVTANPYYPNVLPRKRIRVAYVVGGTPYYRFTGYIKGWPTTLVGAAFPQVTITATTADDRLSRVTLLPPIGQVMLTAGASFSWPMTDAAGAGSAAPRDGTVNLIPFARGGAVSPTFGADGPGVNEGPAVQFPARDASPGAQIMTAAPAPGTSLPTYTVEAWINAGSAFVAGPVGDDEQQYVVDSATGSGVKGPVLRLSKVGGVFGVPNAYPGSGSPVSASATALDAGWHHLAMTLNGAALFSFYLDGALVGTQAGVAVALPLDTIGVGNRIDANGSPLGGSSLSPFGGRIGQVAIYATALSAATILDHYNAAHAYTGETVDQRIARFLGYAGLTSASWNLDASTVALSGCDQTGKDVVTACQDATTSEGGGAAFYVGTDGKAQFRNRSFRKPGSPAFTVDAAADLDGSVFQPAFDDTLIVNQVQGTRATASGAATTQTVEDATSQAAYGVTSAQFTSYAKTDADVLYNAQDQLARQRNPAYQLPQVAVDLATATTAGLYAAVAGVAVGSRIRLSNLPAGAAPSAQCDLYVEGWADAFSTTGYTVTFDTSRADTPPWFLWDDATYGRWQCDGQTLNAAITASATTVVIATSAGKPTFTTNAAMYPLTIQVGAEQITLNNAPAGSTSPQTFTGVTRGVNGTTAAAQAISTAVDLAPASTWAL